MLSLIHNEVVEKNHWLTSSEFTDIVAISQSTPGPIGINCATYVGYTSVIDSGYPEWMAIIGAILASVSILWLPLMLMLFISHLLLRALRDGNPRVKNMFSILRPAVVGLIAAAAILLMSADNFGHITQTPFKFWTSVTIFIFAFTGTKKYKLHPILMILLCGLAGLLIY